VARYELIYVVPVEKGRVGFSEEHHAHPDGRAWVAGDALSDEEPKPVQVAMTPSCLQALSRNRIRRVFPKEPEEEPEAEKIQPIEIETVLPYARQKIADLRELLKERGLPVYGRKTELIARLEAHDEALDVEDLDTGGRTDFLPYETELAGE